MKHEVIVRGMHCGHCVASVRSVFEQQNTIHDVAVNLENGRATFESEAEINLEEIQKELSKVGNYQIELPYEEN